MKTINLQLEEYTKKGLYLILKDKNRLMLTREYIDHLAKEFWDDPERLSLKVKDAVEFQRCLFCPLQK